MKKLGIAAAILAGFVAMQTAQAGEHHEGKNKSAKAHKAKAQHQGTKAKAKGKKATKAMTQDEAPADMGADEGGDMPPVTEEGDGGSGE